MRVVPSPRMDRGRCKARSARRRIHTLVPSRLSRAPGSRYESSEVSLRASDQPGISPLGSCHRAARLIRLGARSLRPELGESDAPTGPRTSGKLRARSSRRECSARAAQAGTSPCARRETSQRRTTIRLGSYAERRGSTWRRGNSCWPCSRSLACLPSPLRSFLPDALHP
jgi:hypothetical protein